jgi:hypothetical protein
MRCRWFSICPLRAKEELGQISQEWRRRYCEGDFQDCRRYQMEKKGIPHPDTLLPDGSHIEG